MKFQFIKLATVALLAVSSLACKKKYDDTSINPNGDLLAAIPVTVTNYDYFERYPIINASVAANATGGTFHIDFQIPADKGTIKEISKVTTTASSAAISLANLNAITGNGTGAALALNATGTGANRTIMPISGNGSNTISFVSSLSNYLAFRQSAGASAGPATTTTSPVSLPVPTTNNSQTPVEIQYYFLITLTDGTTIIPQPVRIRVQP